MIDYILRFPDVETAKVALPDWQIIDDEGNEHWHDKPKRGIIPDVKVYQRNAVWDATDPGNPIETVSAITFPGYWMIVGLTEADNDFYNQPFVVSEHNRDTDQGGGISLIRSKMTAEEVASVVGVAPVFAGSHYFGEKQ